VGILLLPLVEGLPPPIVEGLPPWLLHDAITVLPFRDPIGNIDASCDRRFRSGNPANIEKHLMNILSIRRLCLLLLCSCAVPAGGV
jgi:hypothetical protein